MELNKLRLLYDNRWIDGGIGEFSKQMLINCPHNIEVQDANLKFGISDITSPIKISSRLIAGDVFISPGFTPPLFYKDIKSFITVHDLTHLHYYSSVYKLYYNAVLKPLFKHQEVIFTVSEYTKQEIIEWAKIDASKIVVVKNGVSDSFHVNVKSHDFSFSYIFYPGNKRSYKNLILALRAFALSVLSGNGVKFLLTGFSEPYLDQEISRLKIIDNVIFLGFVNEFDLASYYKGALFTCFISKYEGFGLPILESLACGTPVITSNVSAIPEVGGNSVYYVNPIDLDEIIYGFNELYDNSILRCQLSVSGLERVKLFSWCNSSAKFWQTILECM